VVYRCGNKLIFLSPLGAEGNCGLPGGFSAAC